MVIPNTLELNTLWVSPALEAEVAAHPHLTRETEYRPIPFGPTGRSTRRPSSPRASGAACRRTGPGVLH